MHSYFCDAVPGISQWDTSGTAPRYLSSTHLSARVGGLNPRWNQVQYRVVASELQSSVPPVVYTPCVCWRCSHAGTDRFTLMHSPACIWPDCRVMCCANGMQQSSVLSPVQHAGNEATDAQFAKAMALTGAEFLDCVDYITHVSRKRGRTADSRVSSDAAEAMRTTMLVS